MGGIKQHNPGYEMIEHQVIHQADSEHLLEFSFECTSIPAFWITRDGAIYRVNQAACQSLGYSKAELQALTIFDIDPSASAETWPNHWQKLSTQHRMSFTSRHRTESGKLIPVNINVNFVRIGDREFNVAFAQDLSAQRQAEDALQKTQERHSLVIQATNDGIWDWDLQSNQVYFSERWHAMLGIPHHPPCNQINDWLHRIHPDDLPKVESKLQDYRQGRIEQLETEFRILHANGQYLWFLCKGMALEDYNQQPYRIAGSMTDITERRQAQNQLLHDALHDPLTGLPNRTLLIDLLNEVNLHRYSRADSNFAVLFLDLDRFKLVNDSLGHNAGDQLLIEIASRLKHSVAQEDVVARLGGDEFIVLLRNLADVTSAIETAKRILQNLNCPIYLGEQVIYPGVSIGIAMSHPTFIPAEEYLQQADIAMYQAKASNHAKYALFTEQMQANVMKRLQLEVDLQSALERDEFELFFQPIVNLHQFETVGFEALLRWTHPRKGNISPDVFIPIAEETGFIIPLGNWVIQEACTQLQEWQKLPGYRADLFITINLASHQLMQPNFIETVDTILAKTEANPHNIKLEITESAVIENTSFAREQLLALKKRNFRICMDDFGTGYSSLGYLHQLPIDCLKIDQSFVQQIQSLQDNPEIIRAIVAIAQSLNMSVIAEGIETRQQASLLRDLGCGEGQGYLFATPLSKAAAQARINNNVLSEAAFWHKAYHAIPDVIAS